MITNTQLASTLGFLSENHPSLLNPNPFIGRLEWTCNCSRHDKLRIVRDKGKMTIYNRLTGIPTPLDFELQGKSLKAVKLWVNLVRVMGNSIFEHETSACVVALGSQGIFLDGMGVVYNEDGKPIFDQNTGELIHDTGPKG